MLTSGWATTCVYGGDVFQRVERYRRAQRQARNARCGVYAECRGDFHREQ
jgi:endonuclease YncB( thermonuclease family)